MNKNTEHFISALDMLDEEFIKEALEATPTEKRTIEVSSDDLIICEKQSHKASRFSIFALSVASFAVVVAVASLVAVLAINKVPVADSYSSFLSEFFSSHIEESSASSDEISASSDEASADTELLPDINVSEKIKFMSYYEPDKSHPAFEIFKELYGTPQITPEGYNADENDVIAIKLTGYYNRYEMLSVAINSGDSPDIMPYEHSLFYSGEYCARYGFDDNGNPLFTPIDDVVDMDSFLWDNVRWMNEKITINGRHYAAIVSTSDDAEAQGLLWYKKSQIKKYDLPDPYELYLEGKWTRDAFIDIADSYSQKNVGGMILSSCSYNLLPEFALTSGAGFVDNENGKLVNRLLDDKTTSATDFVEKLLNDYNVSVDGYAKAEHLAEDNTLFLNAGGFRREDILKYIETGNISENDIGVVPLPKKDKQSDHYYPVCPYGYYLCRGGNAEYFKAFITACLVAENNGASAEYKSELLKEEGWSDEIIEKLGFISDQAQKNPAIDLFSGMCAFNHNPEIRSVFERESYRIVIAPALEEMSYKEAVELYGNALEEELNKMNN